MKMVVFAVITLFFPIPPMSAESCDFRNGLPDNELRAIIRRSQSPVWDFSLLITLFLGTDSRFTWSR